MADDQHIEVRVGKLEGQLSTLTTNVDTLTDDVRAIAKDIKDLAHGVTVATGPREFPIQTVFAGMALLGALYAASIRPLEKDIQRHESESLVRKNDTVDMTKQLEIKAQSELLAMKEMIQHEIAFIRKDLDDVRSNGSVHARERMSTLESKTDTILNFLKQSTDKPKQPL